MKKILGVEIGDRKQTILDTAAKLVYFNRNKDYGHPIRNFSNIGGLQNAYLHIVNTRNTGPNSLTPTDIAMLNILQKVARIAENQTHMDSIVDIAGYAATVERIISGE